jgi:hypothetical protein
MLFLSDTGVPPGLKMPPPCALVELWLNVPLVISTAPV